MVIYCQGCHQPWCLAKVFFSLQEHLYIEVLQLRNQSREKIIGFWWESVSKNWRKFQTFLVYISWQFTISQIDLFGR